MPTREQRIRARLFPGERTFDPKVGGYASFPLVLRRALFLFEPRAWQIYSYICMRIGPAGIGWLTYEEMAWDLDFKSIPKLKPYVQQLVNDGWLRHETSRSREYFLARNPVDHLRALHAAGKLPADRVEAIDELLMALKWPLLEEPDSEVPAAPPVAE